MRKLLKIGKSYAITIPRKWLDHYSQPYLHYYLATPKPDGSIVLRPVAFHTP